MIFLRLTVVGVHGLTHSFLSLPFLMSLALGLCCVTGNPTKASIYSLYLKVSLPFLTEETPSKPKSKQVLPDIFLLEGPM